MKNESLALDHAELQLFIRAATGKTDPDWRISPSLAALSPSGFPPGVSMGFSRITFEGPFGRDLLDELERTPWSPNHGRPGEWSKSLSPIQGLTIMQEFTSCEVCGSGYGTQFIVKDDLWLKYGNGNGRMCLLCFEDRMGREIRLEDLMAGPGMNLLAFRIAGKGLPENPVFERVQRFRIKRLETR